MAINESKYLFIDVREKLKPRSFSAGFDPPHIYGPDVMRQNENEYIRLRASFSNSFDELFCEVWSSLGCDIHWLINNRHRVQRYVSKFWEEYTVDGHPICAFRWDSMGALDEEPFKIFETIRVELYDDIERLKELVHKND